MLCVVFLLNSTTKLFVGNIREDCLSADLRALFDKFGEVAECDVVKDYAFVVNFLCLLFSVGCVAHHVDGDENLLKHKVY